MIAVYRKAEAELTAAAMVGQDADAHPQAQFRVLWLAAYHHLRARCDHARFLLPCGSLRPVRT